MTKLETQVFQDDLDKKTLDTLLEMLDHIKVNYVSRQEYNDKKGNILEKTGEQYKLGDFYNLYLPSDLKVGEQVNIIYLLMNNFKLNKILLDPFLARTKVMIGIILRANSELGNKEIEDLQQKYHFPKDFIDDIKNYSLKPDSKTREFIREIKGTSKNKLGSENKEKAEDIYGEKLTQELDLTFFRKSVNDIRTGLEILSQAEHEKILAYIESENKGNYPFKKVLLDGNIYFKRTINGINEIICITNQDFDQETKKLRDKILVDKLKIELEELRKTGNKEKVEEKELEIVNIIIKELENGFHYILNGNKNGYKPIEIQKTKEVYCVGFSIIGHSLLSEFGIKHKGLQIPEHSALEIHIGKDKYYFDATLGLNKLFRIIKEETQVGSIYKKYILEGTYFTYKAVSGDSEKILLSQIYNNKSSTLNLEEAIKMYDKAILLNPKNPIYYNNKGSILSKLGKNKESIEMYYKSIEMYDKSIDLDSTNPDYFFIKGVLLSELGKNKEAIEMYDKSMELDNTNPGYYFGKLFLLSKLGKDEEIIKMYDKAMELESTNPIYYFVKSTLKYSISELYTFVYKIMIGEISIEEEKYLEFDRKKHLKERVKIKDFITKQDFEGLKFYLLSLEKSSFISKVFSLISNLNKK